MIANDRSESYGVFDSKDIDLAQIFVLSLVEGIEVAARCVTARVQGPSSLFYAYFKDFPVWQKGCARQEGQLLPVYRLML